MLIILESICAIILTACSMGGIIGEGNRCCEVNGNVEYLDCVDSLSTLKNGDSGIELPAPCISYIVPEVNIVDLEKQKLGKQLNICPPDFLEDNLNENFLDVNNE